MNVVKFARPVKRKPIERASSSLAIDLALSIGKRRARGAKADDVINLLLVVLAMSENRLAEYMRFDRARRKATQIKSTQQEGDK